VRRHIAFAAALVAVATLAFGAGAATAADTPSLGDAVAARLGITGDQLRAAFKAELNARIDAAIAAGKLTPEQGAKLKQRVANARGLGIGTRRAFAQKHKALVARIVRVNRLHVAAKYAGFAWCARCSSLNVAASPLKVSMRQPRTGARRGPCPTKR